MTDNPPDFVRWLPEARAGSSEALGQVLNACRSYLLLIAAKELDSDLRAKAGASDLVQETLLEAHRDFAQFQGGSEKELLAWLRRMLHNNALNLARIYRGTKKRAAAAEVPIDSGHSSHPTGCVPIAPDSTPSVHAVKNEQAEVLQKALQRLPDDYRQVILLRYQEELPFEEIGQRMGRSSNAAEKLWLRAIERLRQEMETPS